MVDLAAGRVRTLLEKMTDAEFVSSLVLAPLPWIFHGDQAGFDAWKAEAERTVRARLSLFIVGSAATGFSLSPNKAGRAFRPVGPAGERPSDVDVALVSPLLFTSCWDEILKSDRRRELRFRPDELDRVRRGIYFGFVADKSVPRGSAPAQTLQSLAAFSGRTGPFRGHPVSFRVYRQESDLREYQAFSVRQLRIELERGTP